VVRLDRRDCRLCLNKIDIQFSLTRAARLGSPGPLLFSGLANERAASAMFAKGQVFQAILFLQFPRLRTSKPGRKGETMVVVPLAKPATDAQLMMGTLDSESSRWIRAAAAGSLLAGGLLLLNGKKRPGLVAAAAGTALTLLDQKETVRAWWASLPGLIDEAGELLDQVDAAVKDLAMQREKLRALVRR
jgi:hypothetical protein